MRFNASGALRQMLNEFKIGTTCSPSKAQQQLSPRLSLSLLFVRAINLIPIFYSSLAPLWSYLG